MGIGFSGTCKQCNIQQDFFLGVGYLDFADFDNPTQKVVYICSKCGDWTEETISIDDKKKRECPKCKAAMKRYDDKHFDLSKVPRIICKECGGELTIKESIVFWD